MSFDTSQSVVCRECAARPQRKKYTYQHANAAKKMPLANWIASHPEGIYMHTVCNNSKGSGQTVQDVQTGLSILFMR